MVSFVFPFLFFCFSAMALSWIVVDTISFWDCMLLYRRSFTFITISRWNLNRAWFLRDCTSGFRRLWARSNLLWLFKSSSVKFLRHCASSWFSLSSWLLGSLVPCFQSQVHSLNFEDRRFLPLPRTTELVGVP